MRNFRYVFPVFLCVFLLLSQPCLQPWGIPSLPAQAAAEESSVLKGKILDVEGRPVKGASVFIYRSAEVKRPADFISSQTGEDGTFRMVLPPGKYRALARLKKVEGYGPLMPGDKHSGEPKEIELSPAAKLNIDFTIADLKEASLLSGKFREDYVTITGKITDEAGQPVSQAYVIAHRSKKVQGIPDFISAWTNEDGCYSLRIPRGSFYMDAARVFPPDQDLLLTKEVMISSDKPDSDIILTTSPADKK